MKARDIPNLITLTRILLLLPMVLMMLARDYSTALVLMLVAGFSDALDGFLASRFGWQSEFGAKLDPLADKLMLVSSFLTLGFIGLVPAWLVWLVVGRDVIIVAGAFAFHFFIGPFTAKPTWISKLNTLVQVAYVLLVLSDAAFGWFGDRAALMLAFGAALTTVMSGVDYVVTWGYRARRGETG